MPGATKKAWTLFPTRQLCLIPQWIIQRVIWAWILFCHCFSNGTSLDSDRCSKQQTHTTFVSHFESGENKKDPAALPHQSLCFQLLVWLARLGGARLVTTLIAFPSLWWFKFILMFLVSQQLLKHKRHWCLTSSSFVVVMTNLTNKTTFSSLENWDTSWMFSDSHNK